MTIKFLSLNIKQGLFVDRIAEFIKKENFDIVALQEVSGGIISYNNVDCLLYLKGSLPQYKAETSISWRAFEDSTSYFGNATFIKEKFLLKRKRILVIKKYEDIKDFRKRDTTKDPRTALCLTLGFKNKQFQIINTHLAWGPNSEDESHKIQQGKKLYEYLKAVKEPFILC